MSRFKKLSHTLRIFNKFKELKKKSYRGNHLWTEGYCADTVGMDAEMIKKYIKYQKKEERKKESRGKLF